MKLIPVHCPQLRVQVDGQRHEVARHERDEARVAQQPGKLLAQVDLDVLGVEAFEGPIARLLEEDQDGQDLGRVQPRRASSLSCPHCAAVHAPTAARTAAKTHPRSKTGRVYSWRCLQCGLMGREKPHHNPLGASLYPNWRTLKRGSALYTGDKKPGQICPGCLRSLCPRGDLI